AQFIAEQIRAGGAVYIHCRLGEGRGPTVAAAYLISQGMRPEDALAHLRRFRPFARPNKKQVRQLIRFAATAVDE
ncbi:MAG TPA: dual specificity protein phosphatase, partial [Candidatus Saccharimonadales bacterium]|nr:dual specificity protein phosphatase [Candidatus Saccharimonadales bacterium]